MAKGSCRKFSQIKFQPFHLTHVCFNTFFVILLLKLVKTTLNTLKSTSKIQTKNTPQVLFVCSQLELVKNIQMHVVHLYIMYISPYKKFA